MKKYAQYFKEIIFLTGNDIKRVPYLLLIFIFASSLDIIGIGLVAPYISMIIEPERFQHGPYLKYLIQLGLPSKTESLILAIGVILVVVFISKAIASLWINRLIVAFSYNKGITLRAMLIRAYQQMAYSDYLKRNSSESIYSIITLSSIFAQSTLQAALRLLSEGVVALAIFILLFLKNSIAILLFSALIIAVALIYDFLFRKRLVSDGKEVDVQSKKMVQSIYEAIEGLKEIRVLQKEEYFYNRIMETARGVARASISSSTIKAMPRYLLEIVVIFFIVSLVCITIVTENDMVELASTLGIFAAAALRLIPSVNQIISSLSQLVHNRNSIDILYRDISRLSDERRIERAHIKNSSNHFHSVELKEISFSYEGAQKKALSNISLKIESGDSIGFMGTSGAGKSTLVDLLLGLLMAQKGDVLYNGTKLSPQNIGSWIEQVAYLPQQIFLIDDTLRRNVALGVDDREIDEARLEEALVKSNLKSLVAQLPKGLDTPLGERGIRISGGQRQRVAIARAFYFGRDVIIMDEATSALDNNTENEIVDEIRKLKGVKTLIVIAHRLTTLQHCDKIYRLEDGQVVETGTYQQMITS